MALLQWQLASSLITLIKTRCTRVPLLRERTLGEIQGKHSVFVGVDVQVCINGIGVCSVIGHR